MPLLIQRWADQNTCQDKGPLSRLGQRGLAVVAWLSNALVEHQYSEGRSMDAYRPPQDSANGAAIATKNPFDRWRLLVVVGRGLLYFYPALAASLPYVFCSVFWLTSGRLPSPYADDLKSLSPYFSYPHTLAVLLMLNCPIFIAVELIVDCSDPKRNVAEKSTRLIVYLCQCLLAWLIISSDNPINEWFFD